MNKKNSKKLPKKKKIVKRKKKMENIQKLTLTEPLTEGGSLDDEKEFIETTTTEKGRKVTKYRITGMSVEQLLIGAVLNGRKPKSK
jgi:hypothetical protein